eukprot:11013801-Lingulodinium_polyedra.AAC.1
MSSVPSRGRAASCIRRATPWGARVEVRAACARAFVSPVVAPGHTRRAMSRQPQRQALLHG